MSQPINPYSPTGSPDELIQWELGKVYRIINGDTPAMLIQSWDAIEPAWRLGYEAQQRSEGNKTELPCPPYTFEYDDTEGTLTISTDDYTKSGTKPEWQAVIDEMQANVDDMPRQIDLADVDEIQVTVQAHANAQWEVTFDVDQLLSDHTKYDDVTGIWYGTKDELTKALKTAVDEDLDHGDTNPVYDTIEWEEYGERSLEANDLDYDLSNIEDDAT